MEIFKLSHRPNPLKGMHILPRCIDDAWLAFLDEDRLHALGEIEQKIGNHYTPRTENVMRFLSSPLNSLKIVILGQDPYPAEGRATGRAFEVGDLASWQDKFKQVSLKNIVRLLHKTYNGIKVYEDIKKFSEIQKEIKEEKFKILPPDKIFKYWQQQGVLLLNAYLTCEIGNPGSHREIWRDFTIQVIQYMVNKNPTLKWFLWGSDAISYSQYIPEHNIYKNRHPMMCSNRFPDDFLKSNCFQDTRDIVNWLG